MNKTWREKLSSISVKLFICFWLIAFTSILITHFISIHLSKEVQWLPVSKGERHKIHSIAKKINRESFTGPEQLLKGPGKRKGRKLILKHLASNKVSAPVRIPPKVHDYIEHKSLSKLSSFLVSDHQITGPILVTINQENYHLYIASVHPHVGLAFYIQQLPLWLLILIPLVISFGICWLLARYITKPILAMQKISTSFGDGKLSERVHKINHRKDEIGILAQSFNNMAEKLEHNIHSHQRLLADVSHELRSPLTRMQIALALIQGAQNDPVKLEKHLARCEKEINRLDTMLADVLALSRLENTVPNLKISATEINSFICEIVQDTQYLANEKSITIHYKSIKPTTLAIDPQLITSAITNIINNAIKYSSNNSSIDITIKECEDAINIAISDQGVGVNEDELDKLFQPFYRVNTARDRSSGGTGLGLAITNQAILAHKGSLTAYNNKVAGLTVTIGLPL